MNSGSDGAQRLMYCANRISKSLKDMPYHQSDRALFDEVRQIQAEWGINRQRAFRRLVLLWPKMAYRACKEAPLPYSRND